MVVKVNELTCKRCGNKWIPRKKDVRQCPKCRSSYWNEAKEIKKEEEES